MFSNTKSTHRLTDFDSSVNSSSLGCSRKRSAEESSEGGRALSRQGVFMGYRQIDGFSTAGRPQPQETPALAYCSIIPHFSFFDVPQLLPLRLVYIHR